MRHALFVRTAPAGFFIYGGMIAVQALWAGPWMTRVTGLDAAAAARGRFAIKLAMLFTFMAWGAAMPRLARRGIDAMRLMRGALPLCLALLLFNLWLGPAAAAWHWAAWSLACTFVAVFSIRWGIGLLIGLALAFGASEPAAFRSAFGVFAACSLASCLWLVRGPMGVADNPASPRRPASTLET